jgi:hypothetical protein
MKDQLKIAKRSNLASRRKWLRPRRPSILDSPSRMLGRSGELSADLNELVAELCEPLSERKDPETARLLRALGFFEFQIRVIAPKDEDLQRQARMIATIKFLEYIESASVGIDFFERLQAPVYEVLVRFLFASDGWRGVRSLPSSASFEAIRAKREGHARANASIIGLVHRFRRQFPHTPLKGGKRMAASVGHEVLKRKVGSGARTLDKTLTGAGDLVLLQYLMFEHFRCMRPPSVRLAANLFVQRLLKQSSESSIRAFFAAHSHVCSDLVDQFPVKPIRNPGIATMRPLQLLPLTETELVLIRGHYRVRGASLTSTNE